MEWYERAIQMDSRRYVVFIYDLTPYNIIFSQPLTRRERAEAFFMELDQVRELMEDQWRIAPMQWLDNIEEQFKAGFRCINVRFSGAATIETIYRVCWGPLQTRKVYK